LSYSPKRRRHRESSPSPSLPRFPMQVMGAAARAKLLEFQPARVIPPVLLRRVVPLSTLGAFERNHQPVSLRLLSHCTTSFVSASAVPRSPSERGTRLFQRRL